MKWFVGGLVLGVSFIGSFALIFQGNQGAEHAAFNPRSARTPAAIRKVYDFSELDGNALSQASKQRLIAGFDLTTEKGEVGVRLGHFVVSAPTGDKVFACERYDQVVLTFDGEGIAVNGAKPQMQVEGLCEPDSDINRISPLWIPVSRISANTAEDGEQKYENQTSGVNVKFSNVTGQWPPQWVLTQVKLRNSKEEDVTIEASELRRMLERPIVLAFE